MSTIIKKTIVTDDRRFVFLFYFESNDKATEFYRIKSLVIQYQEQAAPFNRIQVFKKDDCGLNIPIQFSIKDCYECDNACLYGSVLCFLREEQLWVKGDYWYGLINQEIHFEGFMAIYPGGSQSGGHPEPEPEPEPAPLPGPGGIIISDSHEAIPPGDHGKDLFPYIYMRRWPRITAQDLELNFIVYQESNTSPPQELLYDKLNNPETPRMSKEKYAVEYINGDFASSAPFLATPDSPEGPANNVLTMVEDLSRLIAENPQPTYNQFLTAAAGALHIPLPTENDERNASELANQIMSLLQSDAYIKTKESVWNSYFALVFVQGYDDILLEELTQIIQGFNLVITILASGGKLFAADNINKLLSATIILPTGFFIHSPSSPPVSSASLKSASPPHLWVNRSFMIPYAIGELQLVKQQFIKYEPGEVAHIENVLRGEKKETQRRKLNRISQSSSQEILKVDDSETGNTDKQMDLSSEIQKTLTDNTINTNYKNLKATYGSPNAITYDGSWTVTEPGQKKNNITKFARDVLNKTLSRINRQVTEIRRSSTLDEIEDTVTSVFDNTGSGSNLMGVYRWLNKVYSNYVVNYGNRLMIECLITNPASGYIAAQDQCDASSPSRPVSPAELGIESYSDIQTSKYPEYAVLCPGIEPPPEPSIVVSATLRQDEEKMIQLPQSYQAKTLDVANIIPSDSTSGQWHLIVGKKVYTLTGADISSQAMNHESGAVAAAVNGNASLSATSPPPDQDSVIVSIEITCQPTPMAFTQWQINTYNAIDEHYKTSSKSYYNNTSNGSDDRRAQTNRIIIHEQLQKACMELLFKLLFRCNPGTAPNIIRTSELRYVQFFNSLFHWDEMYYVFGENFIDGQKTGNPRSRLNGTLDWDRDFCTFLHADYARVILPVQPLFNRTVLFFLATGIVWEGKDCLVPGVGNYTGQSGKTTLSPDTGYLNKNHSDIEILNEMKKISFTPDKYEQIGGTWTIDVPTSMKILQEGDALIKPDALEGAS